MAASSQKMKALPLISLSALSFLLFPLSLNALNAQIVFNTETTSSLCHKEIEKEINSYLINQWVPPLKTDDSVKYEIIDVIEDWGLSYSSFYTIGILSQGNFDYFTLFLINKGWNSIETKMLFMSPDCLLSSILFEDICALIQLGLPKPLAHYHVFIKKYEHPAAAQESELQIWSFYNLEEQINFMVRLTPDGFGGTTFSATQLAH